MDEQLEKILRRVQTMIAMADDPRTPPGEAETARQKADALIFKYKIDLLEAQQGRPTAGLKPIWSTWQLCRYTRGEGDLSGHYTSIGSFILDFIGGRGVITTSQIDNELWWVMQVVGWESDLAFGEVLLTSARLEFGRRLEPRVDPNLSDQENAYHLRHAGLEGRRISELLYGYHDKSSRSKVRAMFVREAVKRGEDPTPLTGQSNSMKVYRKSYAEGFTDELWWRLRNMKLARAEDQHALVLANAKDAVAEAYYERFPSHRPVKRDALPAGSTPETCEKCKKAKSGYCRDHAYLRPQKMKEEKINYTARHRGADAARAVDLGPTGTRRVDDAPRKEIG